MSASPAGAASGQTPNGSASSKFAPKKRLNNPLVPPSRNGSRKASPFLTRPVAKANGASRPGPNGAPRAKPQPRSATSQPTFANEDGEKEEDLGPPTKQFPVFTTKRALLNGIRYHAMRLMARQEEDIYSESSFTRPIRLHRRNPRLQPGDTYAQDGDAEDNDEDPERKLEEQRKAERQAIRQANQAQIAPNVKENPKKRDFTKKIEQVYRSHDNLEAKKRAQLRYEETMPWHLEDFDFKNCWVGNYEANLSETFVVFVPEHERFRMVPVEKWYKFNPKAKFKVLSAEEAEARMAKGVSDPKFVREAKIKAKQEEQLKKNKPQKLFLRKGERGERPGGRGSVDDDERGEAIADENDIDFDLKDDFQDDEENPLFDDEEIEKEAERRITREQKEANVFRDIKEEKDYDAEEAKERLEKQELKKREKATRKALRKEEQRSTYLDSDDSDKNPYSDSSDSESETERLRQEEEAKQREKGATEKAKAEDTMKADGKSSKPASGRGSGTNTPKSGNTPSGRPSKHPVPDRLASSSTLKLPGSPEMSETDGNDSSRKKPKKRHDKQVSANAATTVPSSRPMSPDVATDNDQRKRKARPMGSGSDTETDAQRKKPKMNMPNAPATAPSSRPMSPEVMTDSEGRKRKARPANSGSDTETDGQRKRLKINLSKNPGLSRAGSPGGTAPASAGASRAGSPTGTPSLPMPTAEQVKAAIPPEGINMKLVLNRFRHAMVQDKAKFIGLIKAHARMQKMPNSNDNILYPKGT